MVYFTEMHVIVCEVEILTSISKMAVLEKKLLQFHLDAHAQLLQELCRRAIGRLNIFFSGERISLSICRSLFLATEKHQSNYQIAKTTGLALS